MTPEISDSLAQTSRLSYAFAKRHRVLVSSDGAGNATLVYAQPGNWQSLTEARRFLARPAQMQAVSDAEFDSLLQQSYQGDASGAARMMEDMGNELDLSKIAQALGEPEDLLESADDAPIIRLINAMLTEAVKENASDIHIESFENRLTVRMRVDGVLREILEPPKSIGPLLVSRVKVMANLDIAEKRLPQDGRISLRVAGRPVDVRVSTIPSGHGERVVLRLLDKGAGKLDLATLGLSEQSLKTLDELIHRPHGILLVTGPTGSGKTTTLYGALSRLNDRDRNIMTVEDPIEYYIDGINQTQVNTKVDMSFARGLRAILRQDPDVVMVGEIRDLETAEIAVQASLTGHLVLSTLHTNSATGSITRLRDMGVEPFLLSSSLIGVLAQRLVRSLCQSCCETRIASPEECASLGLPLETPPDICYPVGCDACNHSGYRGRSGIFELISVNPEMQRLMHSSAGEAELETYARNFSPGLRTDGIRRVLDGTTSAAELMRVTHEA